MVRLARLRPSNKARAAYLRRRSTYAPMHDRRGVGRGERGWFFQSKVFKGGKFTRSGNWSVIVLLLDTSFSATGQVSGEIANSAADDYVKQCLYELVDE